MEKNELLRRMEDLCERAERSGTVCSSGYLSPAERYQTEEWAKRRGCTVVFSGGGADCERTAAFFLPEYMSAEDFDPSEHFAAIKLTAHFGEPGHRDYMGAVLVAVLGMGVGREWVGDIRVMGDTAYIFCLPSVHRHLLSIDKVGRCGVTAENIAVILAGERVALLRPGSAVNVLKADGEIGEEGKMREVFSDPQHEYTRQLVQASVLFQEGLC